MYFNKIQQLIKIFTEMKLNFELILIVKKIQFDLKQYTHSKIKIFQFDKFSPDWKMSHVNWNEILL